MTVGDMIDEVSAGNSTWGRADVLRTICDRQQPVTGMPAGRWLALVERAADRVVEHCFDLDPPGATSCRSTDGRSVWIEPTAPGLTSEAVLIEEEHIVAWALDAQLGEPNPSTTVEVEGLDVLQADAAAAVAGWDELVLVVGPAGTGKTTMLARASEDLRRHTAPLFGLAPTAKAARVLERDTGMRTDTVAKLLQEWSRPRLEPGSPYWLPKTTTVIVDEAGMIATHDLCRLVSLAEQHEWRLVLVGDPRQLQAVGRGGSSTSCAATAGSTSSSRSTGSPTRGRRRRHSSCGPATRGRWMPTRRTGGSFPAPSSTISAGSPTGGSTVTRMGTRWRWWRPRMTTSTNSTQPFRSSGSRSGTSTPTPPSRSPVASTRTSATWLPPGATTGGWSPARVSRYATGNCGPSPAPMVTGRSR